MADSPTITEKDVARALYAAKPDDDTLDPDLYPYGNTPSGVWFQVCDELAHKLYGEAKLDNHDMFLRMCGVSDD